MLHGCGAVPEGWICGGGAQAGGAIEYWRDIGQRGGGAIEGLCGLGQSALRHIDLAEEGMRLSQCRVQRSRLLQVWDRLLQFVLRRQRGAKIHVCHRGNAWIVTRTARQRCCDCQMDLGFAEALSPQKVSAEDHPCPGEIGRASCRERVWMSRDGIRDYKVTGVQTCALPI